MLQLLIVEVQHRASKATFYCTDDTKKKNVSICLALYKSDTWPLIKCTRHKSVSTKYKVFLKIQQEKDQRNQKKMWYAQKRPECTVLVTSATTNSWLWALK